MAKSSKKPAGKSVAATKTVAAAKRPPTKKASHTPASPKQSKKQPLPRRQAVMSVKPTPKPAGKKASSPAALAKTAISRHAPAMKPMKAVAVLQRSATVVASNGKAISAKSMPNTGKPAPVILNLAQATAKNTPKAGKQLVAMKAAPAMHKPGAGRAASVGNGTMQAATGKSAARVATAGIGSAKHGKPAFDPKLAVVRFPNNVPVPQAPVPTNGKPRKNQAGLNVRELEHFRELLLAKRRELVGDMSSMEREALRAANGTNLSNLPLHMADMGTDNYEQEFTLGLVEKDRNLLREINRALAKIQDGTYGICEGTAKPINKPRLEAQPWAKFSIEHARMLERGMLMRR